MEKDGVTRVYIGHPLRVLGGIVTKVRATEVYPGKGDILEDDEEKAMGVWANADVQLLSSRFYTNDTDDPLACTLTRVVYAGTVYETRGSIKVEDGLIDAVKTHTEYETIALSIESQLGKTGLTIICE